MNANTTSASNQTEPYPEADPINPSSGAPASNPAASARSRWIFRGGVVTLAVGLGACSGYYFGREPGFAFVGALLGYLVGRIGGARSREDQAAKSRFPNAHLCFVLSVGAWMLILAFGAWVSIAGLLRGEGASLLLMFIVLPGVTICWLVGGPMASLVGRNAMEQVKAGTRPADDLWLAQTGMILSRVMTIVLLGLLLWMLSLIVG